MNDEWKNELLSIVAEQTLDTLMDGFVPSPRTGSDLGHWFTETALKQGGGLAGAAVGGAIATSSVTVLGSSTLGSVALSLGLVSTPIAPVIIATAICGALSVGIYRIIRKL